MHSRYTERTPRVHRLAHAGLTAAAALLTLPAAAGTFTPPQGCEGWLTVQTRSCKVSNHYRCVGDAPGDTWRVDFGINGAYFRSRIDRETQWVESHNSDGDIDLLEADPADPASFTELVETGRDTYEFSTLSSTGVRENVRGYDQLTGHSVLIDGVSLQRTKYEARVTHDDGSLAWHAQGGEYIHPEWRIFLSGAGQVDIGQGFLPQDFTPVDFVFPGEPDFMTTEPIYDCESITASLPVVPASFVPRAWE
jgi:hypothetical protein